MYLANYVNPWGGGAKPGDNQHGSKPCELPAHLVEGILIYVSKVSSVSVKAVKFTIKEKLYPNPRRYCQGCQI